MHVINERDDLFLTLTFTDKEGLALIPTKLVYRVDDVMSGAWLKQETIEYPTTSIYTITISSAENGIVNSENGSEERRLTASIYYLDAADVERRKNTEYFFTVNNLRMVENPELIIEEGEHGISNDTIDLVLG